LGKFTPVPAELGDEKIRGLLRRIFDVNPNTRITAQQLVEHAWLQDVPVVPLHELELAEEQHQTSQPVRTNHVKIEGDLI